MVEGYVAWCFRLIPLCENLRLLLMLEPIVRSDGTCESVPDFLRYAAPQHGASGPRINLSFDSFEFHLLPGSPFS